MKADIAILAAVALVTTFFFWNTASITASYASPSSGQDPPMIPRSIIQSLVEKIQSASPWLQPVNTVYINPIKGPKGETQYNSRIMFLDTRGFFGTQYDVTAAVSSDGTVNILKQTGTSSPSPIGPFDAFTADKYQKYGDIQDTLKLQLSQALQQAKELPGTTNVVA